MTSIPFTFKRFLYKNIKLDDIRKYSKKEIIKAIINYFFDINPIVTLKTTKQYLSVLLKRVYGHLLLNKPKNVPIPKYLLFISGFKRCKYNKEIYSITFFEKSIVTWDGFRDGTTKGRSTLYFTNKKQIQDYRQWYQKENSNIIAAISAKRRAVKFQATPKWLNKKQLFEINTFYNEAKILSSNTSIKHHVDHIVPLQGVNVCGLHVPWNLQVITAKDNIIKSNKYIQE